MEINKALDQISEIHGQLAKAEAFRGYRAGPIALTGLLAISGAFLQARFVADPASFAFVSYWAVVAVICLITGGAGISYNYLTQEDAPARRHTRIVVGQFLPSLVAGLMVTVTITLLEPSFISLLPGFWAIIYSLGIFASRPYLPRIIGWVGLYHLAAGILILALNKYDANSAAWGMGLSFGPGQLLAALVFYLDYERKTNGEKK